MKYKHCLNCGKEIPKDAIFCQYCGAHQKECDNNDNDKKQCKILKNNIDDILAVELDISDRLCNEHAKIICKHYFPNSDRRTYRKYYIDDIIHLSKLYHPLGINYDKFYHKKYVIYHDFIGYKFMTPTDISQFKNKYNEMKKDLYSWPLFKEANDYDLNYGQRAASESYPEVSHYENEMNNLAFFIDDMEAAYYDDKDKLSVFAINKYGSFIMELRDLLLDGCYYINWQGVHLSLNEIKKLRNILDCVTELDSRGNAKFVKNSMKSKINKIIIKCCKVDNKSRIYFNKLYIRKYGHKYGTTNKILDIMHNKYEDKLFRSAFPGYPYSSKSLNSNKNNSSSQASTNYDSSSLTSSSSNGKSNSDTQSFPTSSQSKLLYQSIQSSLTDSSISASASSKDASFHASLSQSKASVASASISYKNSISASVSASSFKSYSLSSSVSKAQSISMSNSASRSYSIKESNQRSREISNAEVQIGSYASVLKNKGTSIFSRFKNNFVQNTNNNYQQSNNQQQNYIYCTDCGHRCNSTDTFCPNCGNKLHK